MEENTRNILKVTQHANYFFLFKKKKINKQSLSIILVEPEKNKKKN